MDAGEEVGWARKRICSPPKHTYRMQRRLFAPLTPVCPCFPVSPLCASLAPVPPLSLQCAPHAAHLVCAPLCVRAPLVCLPSRASPLRPLCATLLCVPPSCSSLRV